MELTGAEGTDTALLALALGVEKTLPPAPVAPFVQKLAEGQ
jgi:mandelamide amidase